MRQYQVDDLNSQREKGQRAEHVAAWYLRLNGFLSIPAFVVHLDSINPRSNREGEPIIQRTEADLIAVRFPYSRETIANRHMTDDPRLVKNESEGKKKPLFILAEVKAGKCSMNGPWTNPREKNMQRVLHRMGFTDKDDIIDQAATSLYNTGRWEGRNIIVQYVCFGEYTDPELQATYEMVCQITWEEIGKFLHSRHKESPLKNPHNPHEHWSSGVIADGPNSRFDVQ